MLAARYHEVGHSSGTKGAQFGAQGIRVSLQSLHQGTGGRREPTLLWNQLHSLTRQKANRRRKLALTPGFDSYGTVSSKIAVRNELTSVVCLSLKAGRGRR
jgi:hypothetical protein